MMKKNTSLGAWLLVLFLLSFELFHAQAIGDFRSKATGNWNIPSTWEKCTSVSPETWVTATQYPGQVAGNYAVTISTGNTVTVNSALNISVGNVNVKGILTLDANLILNTTNQFTIDHGVVFFKKGTELHLPQNSSLIIDIDLGAIIKQGLHPKNYDNSECNNNSALYIGVIKYTSCTGQGNTAAGTFDEVNGSGGSLAASPGAFPMALCSGTTQQSQLFGIAIRYGTSLGTLSYVWSFVSGPGLDPVDIPLGQNPMLPLLTLPGDYVFNLKVKMDNKPFFSDDTTITVTVGGETAFDGTNWSFDSPSTTNQRIAKINSDYDTGILGSFYACSCEVAVGKTLTIGSNTDVTLLGELSNYGNVIIESDGNLVQTNDLAINTGAITVNRISPMMKNNYTYWSSPVSGQNLKLFSQLTANSRFYQYLESNNSFQVVPPTTNNFMPGKGYAIMAPSTYTSTTTTTDFDGVFKGVPTNGTKNTDTSPLEFPLALSAGANRGFNMIGNPYASNIDFDKLFTLNSTKIYNTVYFWTNVDPNRPSSTNGNGDAYSGNAYAIYNGTGGVPATTPGPGTGDGGTSLTPTQFIKVGQGFIVKAKQSGQLIFNNSIRNAVGSSNFMSKGASSDKDRYWLKLTTPAQNVNTILIGYIAGATNDFERDYDAPLMSVASDSFYSLLNENKLGIQGRSYPLNTQDLVTLGTKHFEAGDYKISVSDAEGIFAGSQMIYLKDKQNNIITNLSEGDYTFTATSGENTNRFEIIYKPDAFLATEVSTKSSLEVFYHDASDYVVRSSEKAIDSIELYDATGKLVLTLKGNNSKDLRFHAEKLVDGMYILKAIIKGGKPLTKKIRK